MARHVSAEHLELAREALDELRSARPGLRGPVVLETVLVWARLPAVMAEAAAVRIGDVRGYPARLPDFQYIDHEGAAP